LQYGCSTARQMREETQRPLRTRGIRQDGSLPRRWRRRSGARECVAGGEAMHVWLNSIGAGFFEGVCPPSSLTAHRHAPPQLDSRIASCDAAICGYSRASTVSSDSCRPIFREPPFHALGGVEGARLEVAPSLPRVHRAKKSRRNSGNLRKQLLVMLLVTLLYRAPAILDAR